MPSKKYFISVKLDHYNNLIKAMFQNQNKTNLSQNKDLKIEDFPIHTMKKDLQEIDNPAKGQEPENLSAPQVTPAKEISSEARKTSPFLSKFSAENSKPRRQSEPPSSLPVQPEISSRRPAFESQEVSEEHKPVQLIKLLNISLAISVILLVIGGIYYLWSTGSFSGLSTRISIDKIFSVFVKSPASDNNLPIDLSQEPTPDITPNIPKYSTDKTNYLNLDIQNSGKTKIQDSLKQYATEVQELKLANPVEFILVDLQNNPVSLADFTNKFELKLSKEIMDQMENSFSLFMYNDNSLPQLGLVIAAKDSGELQKLLLSMEKTLVQSVQPLFLSREFTNDGNGFSSSIYRQASIRYKNLSSDQKLSVDYSIVNSKLILGTSKMTIRAVIDYLKK